MHIHILGICGTFMGGLAVLARQAGHRVTGCDANVYPPMSTQLEAQGIDLIEVRPDQLALKPDLFVIGNVVSRGNPLMEAILNRNLPYVSGPQWLGEHVLNGKWTLAVAGTHGKTTTTSMLAWILEDAGYNPGFLVGGVPQNFGISARLTESDFFVIEADEYDTAFFDKRSKFVHYRPRTAILNNLNTITPTSSRIWPRSRPNSIIWCAPCRAGRLVVNGQEPALARVLERGCWSEVEQFGVGDWRETDPKTAAPEGKDAFDVWFREALQGTLVWDLQGTHNRLNAIAAIAAARHVGVPPAQAIESLGRSNVKRRMEVRGVAGGVTVYDDFAHHPTAIQTTLDGLRRRVGDARILAVLEPRSNTMKLGVMAAQLPASLREADLVFGYGAPSGKDALGWNLAEALAPLGKKAAAFQDLGTLVEAVRAAASPATRCS
jgi:UDP-N-acetylmuramate: L-alanyl-gamma-D-glutamyl-meso-diaminopimelate ligase